MNGMSGMTLWLNHSLCGYKQCPNSCCRAIQENLGENEINSFVVFDNDDAAKFLFP